MLRIWFSATLAIHNLVFGILIVRNLDCQELGFQKWWLSGSEKSREQSFSHHHGCSQGARLPALP